MPESAHPFSSPQTLFLIIFSKDGLILSPILSYNLIRLQNVIVHAYVPSNGICRGFAFKYYRTGGICLETKFCYHCTGNLRHCGALCQLNSFQRPNSRQVTVGNASEHFIRWVDFDVTADAMTQAFRYDVDTCQQDLHLNWVDLLAYLGARYGGDFSHYQASDMTEAAEQLKMALQWKN